jgi:hypothetical protein
MLHACFTPIALCFVYTLWHFYAFFGTNLLMRCHSASSLFSAVFVFQKSYTGNILGIGRNEARSSYFPLTRDGVQRRIGEGPGGNHTRWWRGCHPSRATQWCGTSWCPLTSPLHLYKVSKAKTLNQSTFLPVKFRSAATVEDQFWGTKVSNRHPAGMGKCPRSHLYRLHRLHRHLHRRCCLPWWGRSCSPPGLRALPVAMWFIYLSDDVIYMWSWALYLVELVDVVLHLLCYTSGFIIVISGDTLYHNVKVIVCALCVSLWLNFAVILVMSYDLSWMSLWIVVFVGTI